MTQMRSSTSATTQDISSAFQYTDAENMYSHCKKCLNLTPVCEIADTIEQRFTSAQSYKILLGLEVSIICESRA